jgi:hypothetical protein
MVDGGGEIAIATIATPHLLVIRLLMESATSRDRTNRRHGVQALY